MVLTSSGRSKSARLSGLAWSTPMLTTRGGSALVRCFAGARPPVDFFAFCLVRAMTRAGKEGSNEKEEQTQRRPNEPDKGFDHVIGRRHVSYGSLAHKSTLLNSVVVPLHIRSSTLDNFFAKRSNAARPYGLVRVTSRATSGRVFLLVTRACDCPVPKARLELGDHERIPQDVFTLSMALFTSSGNSSTMRCPCPGWAQMQSVAFCTLVSGRRARLHRQRGVHVRVGHRRRACFLHARLWSDGKASSTTRCPCPCWAQAQSAAFCTFVSGLSSSRGGPRGLVSWSWLGPSPLDDECFHFILHLQGISRLYSTSRGTPTAARRACWVAGAKSRG